MGFVGAEKKGDERLKTRIFAKGLSLYEEGKVSPSGETNKGAYFDVSGEHEDYLVRISSDGTFGCTCMRGALQGVSKGSICSHVVASIIYLSMRSRKDGK